jgi:hypothetical protein
VSARVGGCVLAAALLAGCGGGAVKPAAPNAPVVAAPPVVVTPPVVTAPADVITWSNVWMNADGTAGVIVGDSDMYMYDGYQLASCSVSQTDTPDYLTIGPCLLHTPTDHYVTVTLTVYGHTLQLPGYDGREYDLIDVQATFN